jgi:hypothetical protein
LKNKENIFIYFEYFRMNLSGEGPSGGGGGISFSI